MLNDINYSIRVINEDGDPEEDARVKVTYIVSHETGDTDEDGWVQFNTTSITNQTVDVEVSINGDSVGKLEEVGDGDTFSFTI